MGSLRVPQGKRCAILPDFRPKTMVWQLTESGLLFLLSLLRYLSRENFNIPFPS